MSNKPPSGTTSTAAMKTSLVPIMLVEAHGRRWIVGPKGTILAEVEDVAPCSGEMAVAAVSKLLASEKAAQVMRREKEEAEKWLATIQSQAWRLSGLVSSPKSQDEWKARLYSCARCVVMRMKRGTSPPKPRATKRTWTQVFQQGNRLARTGGWNDREDEWGVYAAGAARNIRGRFRRQDTEARSTSAGGRHAENLDAEEDA